MNFCLFIDTNGKIRVNELPEKPNYEEIKNKIGFHAVKYAEREYESALQAALDNGVECEDQEFAGMIFPCDEELIETMVPYPLPEYKMEVVGRHTGFMAVDLGFGSIRHVVKKLATLTLISNG